MGEIGGVSREQAGPSGGGVAHDEQPETDAPRYQKGDGGRCRRHHAGKRARQDRATDQGKPHDGNRPSLQRGVGAGAGKQRMHRDRKQQTLQPERPEGEAPQTGVGEGAADERPAQRRRHPYHGEAGDHAWHQPVRKEAVLGDVDQRHEGTAAEPLHRASGEQHRHCRCRGADHATECVHQGRGQHGPAKAEGRHACADRGGGHDRAHQVQGEGPTDEPQATDFRYRLRHRGRGQHRVGGMQPDRQAQREELGQVGPGQDLAPARVSPERRFGWTSVRVLLHDSHEGPSGAGTGVDQAPENMLIPQVMLR